MKSVPAIVRIIITQANRWRAEGAITEEVFDEQLRRLVREELEPKGLTMLVRHLPAGRTRFIIKKKESGAFCEMMDFAADGNLDSDVGELVSASAEQSQPSDRTAHDVAVT